MKIGVIGSRTPHGKWLVEYFRSKGSTVICSDLGSTKTPEYVAQRCGIVFLTNPESVTRKIIKDIFVGCVLRPLWVDVAGVGVEASTVLSDRAAECIGLRFDCPAKGGDLRGKELTVHYGELYFHGLLVLQLIERFGAKTQIVVPAGTRIRLCWPWS